MILETVIFTALPTSRTANALFVTCFAAPRLEGEEGNPRRLELSRYTDFANGQWARIVSDITWNFTLRWSADDSDEDYLTAERVSPDPDPQLFATMFPSSMPVDPFAYDNIAKQPIMSFPLAVLSDALDDVQVRLARQSPEDRPAKDDLVTPYQKGGVRPPDALPLDPFNLDPQRRASLSTAIDRMLERDGVTRAPAANPVPGSVEELNRMLQAPDRMPDVPPMWPDLDFHQAVSMLASHPNLLRKLGFIIDLRVPLVGWNKRYGTPRVFVGSSWPAPYDPDVTGVDITTSFPRLKVNLTSKFFRAIPESPFLREDGFVDARSIRGVTSEVEVETLAMQTEATAISREQQESLSSFGSATDAGTPARHSTGVALAVTDYAATLKAIMLRQDASNAALRTGDDVPISADDVFAGYRLDVRRAGDATWRTLHRRHGTLSPYVRRDKQAPVDLGDDEGWVEPAATGDAADDAAAIRLSETLARWSGWSLAIPPPGKLLDESSHAADPIGPGDGWAVIDSLHGTVDYAAPADGALLPLLRFSKTDYEMRLRWVSMAGTSVGPDVAGGSIVTVPFRRQDPVASPGVYLAADPVWGESVDVVVLRKAVVAARNRTSSTRYVAPPSVSAELALMHGKFDDPRGRPRVDAYDTIAERETAAFAGDQLARNPATVPYLADPLAHALFVRGVPSGVDAFNAEATLVYGGTWPALRVLEVVLDGQARPGASTIGTRMTVGIPAGRVVRLRLSNGLTQDGLELMDLWRRAAGFGQVARARAGAWWQLTPDRELVVVHAVQVPLTAPAFVNDVRPAQRWRATRSVGDSAAAITGRISVDAPSTQAVDFGGVASWFVDDGPGSGGPYVAVRQDIGVLGTVQIGDDPAGGVQAYAAMRAPLSDTRRVAITVSATAKSRFAEYFRESSSFAAGDAPVVVNGGAPVVPDTVRVTYVPAAKDDSLTARTEQYTFDPVTATFRRAALPAKDRIPDGATITVSYIPEPIAKSSRQAPIAQRSVDVVVPSSARPLAPEVALIVPTFRWEGTAGALQTSTRIGGGLRVYLRRPWGSSGLNEDLGVVLLRDNARGAFDAAEDLVTRWGQDPTLLGTQPPMPLAISGYPGADNFTNRSSVARAVTLAETGAPVDVVRYAVGAHDAEGVVTGYDAERDMWFADIDIDAGDSYRPMIQLALARYQSASVADLSLSPLVLVDVVQLEPDRVATVRVTDGRVASSAAVTMSGPSYRSNEYGTGPGLARVVLEQHMGGDHSRSGSSAAWQEVRRVDLVGSLDRAGLATWTGDIPVPRARAANQYRLAFEQFETLRQDGEGRPLNGEALRAARGLRLVSTDVIYLSASARPPKSAPL